MHRERPGFTMVELLAVIGIIGLLVGILLPSLRRARQAANAMVCSNNLRVMGQCTQMYVNDFGGVLPWEGYAEGDRKERHVGRWDDPGQWFNVWGTYCRRPSYDQLQVADKAGGAPLPKAGDRTLYICPDSHAPSEGIKDDLVVDGYLMLWGLEPDNTVDRRKTYWSYAYNSQLDSGVEDRNVGYRVCIKQNRIPQPAHTVLLLERILDPYEFKPSWTSGVGCTTTSWSRFTTRHNRGGYVLMIDGHVQFFTHDEVNQQCVPGDYNWPGKIIWNPAAPTT